MVSPLNIATTWGRSIMAKPGRRMCCRKIGSCGKRSRLRKILTVKMSRTAESCFFFFFNVFRKIDYRLVKDNYWLLLIVSWGWDEFWCFFPFFFLMGLGIVWLWFLFMFGELRIIDYGWVKDDHRYTNCCLFLVICDGLKKTCWFFFAIL